MSGGRVLIADDSSLARQAVRSLLKQDPAFEVVGEAADGFEAVKLANELMPELILMDINMPHCDGLMATRMVKYDLPYVTVVMLTVSGEAADLFEAIRCGAQGYLLKSLEPDLWLDYLRGIADGETMTCEVARRILDEFTEQAELQTRSRARTLEPDLGLTAREWDVLRLVGEAMTNNQVAEALYISEQTVKNHIKNILSKLHLKNRVELALQARELRSNRRRASRD